MTRSPRHAHPRRHHLGVSVLLPLLLTSAVSYSYGEPSTSLTVTTAAVAHHGPGAPTEPAGNVMTGSGGTAP